MAKVTRKPKRTKESKKRQEKITRTTNDKSLRDDELSGVVGGVMNRTITRP